MKNRERDIVDFVISEVFAPDGPLVLRNNIHLKPYEKNNIRRYIRGRVRDEFDIEFTDEEVKWETEKQYVDRTVKAIQDSL